MQRELQAVLVSEHVARYGGQVARLPKGAWRRSHSTPGPILGCPGCGLEKNLGLGEHAISADGTVTREKRERYTGTVSTTQVISCNGCGWTGYVRLSGWRG